MAGTGLVAGEAVVDALPYFDQGYEAPGVREAVSEGLAGAGGWEQRRARGRPSTGPSSFAGCGAGGGGDSPIPAHQELPELPDGPGLLRV